MKCIQKLTEDSKVQRVRDKKASEMVDSGDYKYVPKSEWKKQEKSK